MAAKNLEQLTKEEKRLHVDNLLDDTGHEDIN